MDLVDQLVPGHLYLPCFRDFLVIRFDHVDQVNLEVLEILVVPRRLCSLCFLVALEIQ